MHSVDFRMNKAFRFGSGKYSINFDADIFNLFNSAVELGRIYDRRLTTFNEVREIMNPRILRLGIRVGF